MAGTIARRRREGGNEKKAKIEGGRDKERRVSYLSAFSYLQEGDGKNGSRIKKKSRRSSTT